MGKVKYNTEVVRQMYVDAGCELLDEYVSCNRPMRGRCKCGREWSCNLSNFLQGKRCRSCAGVEKYTIEHVREVMEAAGCRLLSTEYEGAHAHLDYICSCGRESKITFGKFRQGRRCNGCRSHKVRDQLAFTFDQAREEFRIRGCELLETEYVNARRPMRYRCKCGTEAKICLYSLKNGNECRECGKRKNRGENNWRWKPDRAKYEVERLFAKRCYSLVYSTLRRLGFKDVKEDAREYVEVLGYDSKSLRSRLESFPDWDTIKETRWEIDHIFPIRAFLDYGITDLKIINGLDNLRPMPRSENRSKNAKYEVTEFENFLRDKGMTTFGKEAC